MPKISTVTIEKVQAAYQQMVQEEGKSSLRGVFERLGKTGSITVVSELYDIVVAKEHEAERFRHKNLSQDVHVAIHQEIEHHVLTNTASLNNELATTRESLIFLENVVHQTNARVDTAEFELAQLAAEIEKRDRQAIELTMKSEIALGAKAELIETIKSELASTRLELENARFEVARLKNIEGQLAELKKQFKSTEEALKKADERAARLDERQKLNGLKTRKTKTA
jgi:chromosome segregation ATPase